MLVQEKGDELRHLQWYGKEGMGSEDTNFNRKNVLFIGFGEWGRGKVQ